MVRLFDRNMFIMLIAIMVGIVIITYFIADIQRRTQIETLTIEHETQLFDIAEKSQNFTRHFRQGSIKMDQAREEREGGNSHFDVAFLWYTTGVQQDNQSYITFCMANCTDALVVYPSAYTHFEESTPYFMKALDFTENEDYIKMIRNYVNLSKAGMNSTQLRLKATRYLLYIAQNLSLGNTENISELFAVFNETQTLVEQADAVYDEAKGQVDTATLFDPIREPH